MSIAEKLQTVAENVSKVYNAGYEKGKSEGGDNPLNYATFESGYIFYKAVFPENYELDFNITGNTGSISTMRWFAQSNVYKVKIGIDRNYKAIAANYMFQNCANLVSVKIKNDSLCLNNCTYLFDGCTALESIDGVIDISQCGGTNSMFNKCYALKEVRFVSQSINANILFDSCADLSVDSINSIINGLADMTGKTSCTLFVHGNVFSRMTVEQKTIIASKNWTLSAVA